MKTDEKAISDVYNRFGDYYHDSRKKTSGRLHNEFIDIPATLSLLPNSLKNKKILDAGCGSGIYSVLLTKKDGEVIGVDISKKMIEIATRQTPKGLNIKYLVSGLYDLPFKNESFDIIVCNYVLENVEDLAKVFEQFFKVLTKKGVCIISLSHFMRGNSTPTIKDNKEQWVVENYFNTELRKSNFGGGMIVPKYRRTLQNYVDDLSKVGFVIERILEPQPIPEGELVDKEGYEKAMRLPQIMTMKLIKH